MSSLIDAFNNFIKSLQPQEVGQLNLRSCLGCSFHKEILKDHFCTQVQPPSKIFNPYDAQLCIYYTPETATTGPMTKAERETQSSKLDVVKQVETIFDVTVTNPLVLNGSFETGTLVRWQKFSLPDNIFVTTEKAFDGLYSVKYVCADNSPLATPEIDQLLPFPLTDDVAFFKCRWWGDVGTKMTFKGYNIDGSGDTITQTMTMPDVWKEFTVKGSDLTSGKRIDRFGFYPANDAANNNKTLFLDDVKGYLFPFKALYPVTQLTRTNLLVKPEREDLLLKDLDFASNVALQSYLAAVPNVKHKVYSYGFEVDADGTYYFSATVNGAAFKFGRRITKGVMVQTLVNPIVCDTNTALEFLCFGGNAKTCIQYKTEA